MNIKGGCYCSEIRYESKGEVKPLYNVIVENANI